ncbi:hypothetical protein [Actinomadura sp. 9N215]|uniref:hypothetical protein n=1 Tax=Actinomadura sp. 9N215 TaxID=3375150 RepID=UPI00379E6C20
MQYLTAGATAPCSTVFRVRAGLTALDLAGDNCEPPRLSLLKELLHAAETDAYAARDALNLPLVRAAVTAPELQQLANVLRAAGLATGENPHPLDQELTQSAALATKRLRRTLHPRSS